MRNNIELEEHKYYMYLNNIVLINLGQIILFFPFFYTHSSYYTWYNQKSCLFSFFHISLFTIFDF